jgi:hypothetical protein
MARPQDLVRLDRRQREAAWRESVGHRRLPLAAEFMVEPTVEVRSEKPRSTADWSAITR